MDHILKTIEDFEAKIEEHQRAINSIRAAINQVCSIAGMEPRYQLNADEGGAAPTVKSITSLKGDEFYNKPLSTAVRMALNMLRAAGKAPAKIDAIYDVMMAGGYVFENKGRDAAIQGLSVSIGKNSALFVKMKNGLIGVTEWYGEPRRQVRVRASTNGSQAVPEDESDQQAEIDSPESIGEANQPAGGAT